MSEGVIRAWRLSKARYAGDLTGQIQALPLEQLEALADALLDFHGPANLTAWLAANG